VGKRGISLGISWRVPSGRQGRHPTADQTGRLINLGKIRDLYIGIWHLSHLAFQADGDIYKLRFMKGASTTFRFLKRVEVRYRTVGA
jgi:hypothetical protein